MQQQICGTHAPKPHCEPICHATCEKRDEILKKLKCLLNSPDYRKCVLQDIPIKCKRPAVSDFPNPKRPLITNTGVETTRLTGNPNKCVDDPPDLYFVAAPNLKPVRLPLNTPGRKKSVELKGGIFYGSCFCVKRNGLQGDCPRSDCLGRPECLALSPGPCCEPALAVLGKTLADFKKPKEKKRRQSDSESGIECTCSCTCH